jgi:hypothetical protein
MTELDERIRRFIDCNVPPISAEEVIAPRGVASVSDSVRRKSLKGILGRISRLRCQLRQ